MSVKVKPITPDDWGVVSQFLHTHLNQRVSAETWKSYFQVPWQHDSTNSGFMLVDGAEPVGAFTALYANRSLHGREERFCNLGAWCVLPGYRLYSLRLLHALIAQRDYHFTSLSEAEHVMKIMQKHGFQVLDPTLTYQINVPCPKILTTGNIITDRDEIADALHGEARQVYEDHRAYGVAEHLAVGRTGDYCHVVYRKRPGRNPPRVAILHVSDRTLYLRHRRTVGKHFLAQYGALLTSIETRFLRRVPLLSMQSRRAPTKVFRSTQLSAESIDNMYSELLTALFR